MSTVDLSPIDSLEAYATRWDDLVQHAIEPNGFFEPWAFIPAWRHFSESHNRCLMIFDSESHERMIGFFPLTSLSTYRHLPIRHLGIWKHRHCFLGAPLIRTGYEEETFRKFFEWVDQVGRGWMAVEFPHLYADGPFARALRKYSSASKRATDQLDDFSRAVLEPRMPAEEYLETALKRKHRKDFEKKMEALSRFGEVELRMIEPADKAPEWTRSFLSLEGGGWKAKHGTSMIQSVAEREFFLEFVDRGVQERKLIRQMMTVGGEPVCGRISIRSGTDALSFKIAFDERYSRFSPGMLLEMANLRWVLAQSPPLRMDSCAAPNAEMFRRLWLDVVRLESLVISKDSLGGKLAVHGLIAATQKLRDIRSAFRGAKALVDSN